MKQIYDYIDSNFNNFLEDLKDLLRIPSISSNPEKKGDVRNCAYFAANKLREIGINKVNIFDTQGHPIVYGEWLGAPGKPTLLIYGHYDVQPPEPLELWKYPPFEPVIEDDKIWARGATDDKGQFFAHLKSVESIFKVEGTLPINVKFLFEGEEEIGSSNLKIFLDKHKELLKCDAVLISDTSLYEPGVPTITYGLRGLCYAEIEVEGPNRDLHSGSYGGAVINPINALTNIISKLKDKNEKITIPNFYKDVLKISDKEKKAIKKLKFNEKEFLSSIGLKNSIGEKGFNALERIWFRPSLDCNGIWGGFTGEGAKTVIPSKAFAKISIRLVPNQNPAKIFKELEKYLKSLAPKDLKINVKQLHGGDPAIVPIDHPVIAIASKSLTEVFGKETCFIREGGSIPIVVEFMKKLKAPAILMGLGLDSENLHSPNEHFSLTHLRLGMKASANFIMNFANYKRK